MPYTRQGELVHESQAEEGFVLLRERISPGVASYSCLFSRLRKAGKNPPAAGTPLRGWDSTVLYPLGADTNLYLKWLNQKFYVLTAILGGRGRYLV